VTGWKAGEVFLLSLALGPYESVNFFLEGNFVPTQPYLLQFSQLAQGLVIEEANQEV
jgi:hypothetical protein